MHDGHDAVHRPGPLHRLPGVRGRLPRVRLAPGQVHDPPGLHRRRARRPRPCRRSACTARTRWPRAPRSARPTPSWSPPTASSRRRPRSAASAAATASTPARSGCPSSTWPRCSSTSATSATTAPRSGWPRCAPPSAPPGPSSTARSRSWRPTARAPRRSTCSSSATPRSAPAAPWSPPTTFAGPVPGRHVMAEWGPGASSLGPRRIGPGRSWTGSGPTRRSPGATTCASWSRSRPGWPRAPPGWPIGLFRRHGSGTAAPAKVADRLEPGQAVAFRYPGDDDRALAIRLPDGRLVGWSAVCTHLACAVLWRDGGRPPRVPLPRRRVRPGHRRGPRRPPAPPPPSGPPARGRRRDLGRGDRLMATRPGSPGDPRRVAGPLGGPQGPEPRASR